MSVKKWCAALFVAVMMSTTLASAAEAAIEVSGDAYVGIYDKYLWRGIDFSAGQPVLQGGADVSFKGFTLGFWSNMQLSHGGSDALDSGEVTETDIVLDYTFSPVDGLAVSLGNITYTFNIEDSATNEGYLGFALDALLSPNLMVYYDWDDEEGFYYTLDISHGFALADGLDLNLSGLVSYSAQSPAVFADDGSDFSDWSTYELGLSLDYAVTDQIVISPSFLWSDTLSDDAEDVGMLEDEILAGVSVSLNF